LIARGCGSTPGTSHPTCPVDARAATVEQLEQHLPPDGSIVSVFGVPGVNYIHASATITFPHPFVERFWFT